MAASDDDLISGTAAGVESESAFATTFDSPNAIERPQGANTVVRWLYADGRIVELDAASVGHLNTDATDNPSESSAEKSSENTDTEPTDPGSKITPQIVRLKVGEDLSSFVATSTLQNGEQNATAETLVIMFEKSSDGRGFSMVPQLRRQGGYQGVLVAAGINPDQVSAAFQIGFDCIEVNAQQWQQYTEQAWIAALKPVVTVSYLSNSYSGVKPIWQSR